MAPLWVTQFVSIVGRGDNKQQIQKKIYKLTGNNIPILGIVWNSSKKAHRINWLFNVQSETQVYSDSNIVANTSVLYNSMTGRSGFNIELLNMIIS